MWGTVLFLMAKHWVKCSPWLRRVHVTTETLINSKHCPLVGTGQRGAEAWHHPDVCACGCWASVIFWLCLLIHREQIIKQSTELVCRAYAEVHAAVMNPDNAYKDPESILHRSPEQVKTLLSWWCRWHLQIIAAWQWHQGWLGFLIYESLLWRLRINSFPSMRL